MSRRGRWNLMNHSRRETYHSDLQPGGNGGWGIAWLAIFVSSDWSESRGEIEREVRWGGKLSRSRCVAVLIFLATPWSDSMLCSRRPNTLLNAFSRPAKRRCLSSSQNRSIPQPPYKILFFGADKFSCVTLETLYAARKGMSLIAPTPRGARVLSRLTSFYFSLDLIQHLVVVTPPDQRTGRKLKQIHRRK